MQASEGVEGNEAVAMSELLATVGDPIEERSPLKHRFYRCRQSGELNRKKPQASVLPDLSMEVYCELPIGGRL